MALHCCLTRCFECLAASHFLRCVCSARFSSGRWPLAPPLPGNSEIPKISPCSLRACLVRVVDSFFSQLAVPYRCPSVHLHPHGIHWCAIPVAGRARQLGLHPFPSRGMGQACLAFLNSYFSCFQIQSSVTIHFHRLFNDFVFSSPTQNFLIAAFVLFKYKHGRD